jgi:alpha-N-arabinofuranosidase
MFAQNVGDMTVPVALSGVPLQTQGSRTLPGIFVSATRQSKSGALFIKMVNPLATTQDVNFDLTGGSIAKDGTMTILTGDPKSVNTLADPKNVVPVTTNFHDFGNACRKTLPPNSVTVLKLQIAR